MKNGLLSGSDLDVLAGAAAGISTCLFAAQPVESQPDYVIALYAELPAIIGVELPSCHSVNETSILLADGSPAELLLSLLPRILDKKKYTQLPPESGRGQAGHEDNN